jgi:hypothetical protein
MRKGIKKYPRQLVGLFFGDDEACAIGCVIYGVFEKHDPTLDPRLKEIYPELDSKLYAYPDSDNPFGVETLKDIIVTLNDDAGWSREQIADWLEEKGL